MKVVTIAKRRKRSPPMRCACEANEPPDPPTRRSRRAPKGDPNLARLVATRIA